MIGWNLICRCVAEGKLKSRSCSAARCTVEILSQPVCPTESTHHQFTTVAWPLTEKYGSMANRRNGIIVKMVVGYGLE
jgi:hypothetical protein